MGPQPQLDMSKLDMSKPEEVMKLTKSGKTVMMFVRINNFKSREETEEVTSLWQTGLYNNHVQAERFVIEDDRVMFMFRDGKYAWDAKDFLVDQERCEDSVTLLCSGTFNVVLLLCNDDIPC